MLNHGPLPPHYLVEDASEIQAAYVDQYLKEEVLDEGLTRNLPEGIKRGQRGDQKMTWEELSGANNR